MPDYPKPPGYNAALLGREWQPPGGPKMLSRRDVIMGALAASASCPRLAHTQIAPTMPGGNAPPTTLRLQRRTLEMNGRPASVFGIRQPNGTPGLIRSPAD